MLLRVALSALLATAAAWPVHHNRTGSVKVTMRQAGHKVAVTGFTEGGVDSFLGIPFAEPPVGELRFAHPMPKTYTADVNATVMPPACPQENQTKYNAYGFSEDCLTLNVLRPASGKRKKLPVMVWIYGGGFYEGSAQYYYSPSFVSYGIDTDRPFILVQMNYRLGVLGFGYGPDIAAHGAANLGIRDQLVALRWVRDNIASFGGDPQKVTVFGQSAGAISIATHLFNTSMDLFRGAILHSGAPSTLPEGPTDKMWNSRSEQFASFVGCHAPNTSILAMGQSTFDCMKAAPADTLVAANLQMRMDPENSQAYYIGVSVDGDLVPAQPIDIVRRGAFKRVPMLIGNTRDEGFYSLPIGINGSLTPQEFFDLSQPEPVPSNLVNAAVEAYPNIPEIGSPFGTGNETFGEPPAYKQYAAMLGDMAFQSRRRFFLRKANDMDDIKTWTFEWWGRTTTNPPEIGIAHSSDLPYLFGRATAANNYTATQTEAAKGLMNYWINFAYYLDPNGRKRHKGDRDHKDGSDLATYWPPHRYPDNKNQIRMAVGNFSVVQDDYREDQMKVWELPGMDKALHYKRAWAA